MPLPRPTLLALAALALPAPAIGAPPEGTQVGARIQASLDLRDRWQWLTRDIAFPARWDEDGRHFHYRKTIAGGFAFVEIDAATKARSVPFDPAAVAIALTALTGEAVDPKRLPFEQFDFAENRHTIVAWIGERRIRCTLAAAAGCVDFPEADRPRGFGVVRDLRVPADNTPRRSPDGLLEALVLDDNLVVRAVGGDRELWRSPDGTAGAFYDPETIAWSPESRRLALYRVRPGVPRYVTRVVTAPPGKVQPTVVQQLYPKPGDAIDQERPVVFDVRTGTGTTIDDALFADPWQLAPIEWHADGRSFGFLYVRRGFQTVRVIEVDAATGAAHAGVTEEAETFIDRDRLFSHDVGGRGQEAIWASERDGWRHIYLIDTGTGRIKRQITKGPWVVRDIAHVDDRARRIVFSASGRVPGEDPYHKHWYRVDFDGRNLVRLTGGDATYDGSVAPDGKAFVSIRSTLDKPEIAEWRSAEDGRVIATLEQGDAAALVQAGYRPPEPFVAKGRDGRTDIYGVVVRPRDFDPTERYPVIENIYAGPHDSFVPKGFWPFGGFSGGDRAIGMQALADLGFIVVMIDGMGTANRSRTFHDVAWKNMDDMGFPDRIAWIRALAAREPSADLSRVGIYGGSAGGQNALNGLLFHPDFYKAGVAFAGCFDNRMDKIDWNEQWLGWPVDQSYLDASGVVHAAKLQGRLLMVVGEQDSNVDPASTMQVVDALIRADKDFELLVIPNGGHSAGRTTPPVAYGQRREYDFFLRTLRGEHSGNHNTVR